MPYAFASSRVRRTTTTLGVSAVAAGLLWLGYVWFTRARYGKRLGDGSPDPLLDRFMPRYEVREHHEISVPAPAELTFDVARKLDLQRSGLVRAIFRGRELLMGAKPVDRERPQSFLSEVLSLGWRVLAEEPGQKLVVGAVTQPWKADVEFRGLPLEEFVAFDRPGYAKIAWTLDVEATGPDSSIFRTETRVSTTDPESRRRFRRYWSMVSPGVVLIRHEMLKLVRREAEKRFGLETLAQH